MIATEMVLSFFYWNRFQISSISYRNCIKKVQLILRNYTFQEFGYLDIGSIKTTLTERISIIIYKTRTMIHIILTNTYIKVLALN